MAATARCAGTGRLRIPRLRGHLPRRRHAFNTPTLNTPIPQPSAGRAGAQPAAAGICSGRCCSSRARRGRRQRVRDLNGTRGRGGASFSLRVRWRRREHAHPVGRGHRRQRVGDRGPVRRQLRDSRRLPCQRALPGERRVRLQPRAAATAIDIVLTRCAGVPCARLCAVAEHALRRGVGRQGRSPASPATACIGARPHHLPDGTSAEVHGAVVLVARRRAALLALLALPPARGTGRPSRRMPPPRLRSSA
jgi:hypothetical protein